MNKKVKVIASILILVILFLGAYFAYNALLKNYNNKNEISIAQSDTQSSQAEKIKAPDFTVVDTDGKKVKLSDFIGKPIVLNFWASWCPPCKAELPDFEKAYKDNKDDVQFLMIDLPDGQRETVEKAKDFIKDNGYSFPVYFDTDNDAGTTYGISSIPTTLFIDKDGYVVAGRQGQINESTLKKEIEAIKE